MHSKGKPTAASAKIAPAPADAWRKKSALLGSSELIAPSTCTALNASTQISIRMHDTVYCCLKGHTALSGDMTWKDGWQKRILCPTVQGEKDMFITKQLTSFVLAAQWAWYVKTGFDLLQSSVDHKSPLTLGGERKRSRGKREFWIYRAPVGGIAPFSMCAWSF